MDAPFRAGERNAWYRSELVVSLEHRREVLGVLEAWGVGVDRPAAGHESADLGLALVSLADDEQAAAAAVDGLRREQPAVLPDDDLAAQASSRPSAVDRLLWALRARFAARYEGWVPTLGKNRLVANVEGGGNISHGNISHGDDPPSLAASDWRPEPAVRPGEPGLGVRVGVLDTAMSVHPWLAGGLLGPAAECLPPASAEELPALAGHATFVAGLVAQRAPGCTVVFRRVLSDDGSATSWDVARRIVELGRSGVDVLNLSLGSYTEDGRPPLVLATAVDRLDPGIVVVASAGNHGDVPESEGERGAPPVTAADRRKASWPAALDDVVAVGAAADDGTLAPFTPPDVPWIDVLCHGVGVPSTYLSGRVDLGGGRSAEFDGYARWNGTSFAAALVSGEIARRTRPGRLSAREAWQEVLDELTRAQPDARPPFLRLG